MSNKQTHKEKYTYIIIEDKNNPKSFLVKCIELPQCSAQAESLEDAHKKIRIVVEGLLDRFDMFTAPTPLIDIKSWKKIFPHPIIDHGIFTLEVDVEDIDWENF